MPKRPVLRATFNPSCKDCESGWRKVKIKTRHGRENFTVIRCHCFKLVEKPRPLKSMKNVKTDSKSAAAGKD
jgi:hypothetical protein